MISRRRIYWIEKKVMNRVANEPLPPKHQGFQSYFLLRSFRKSRSFTMFLFFISHPHKVITNKKHCLDFNFFRVWGWKRKKKDESRAETRNGMKALLRKASRLKQQLKYVLFNFFLCCYFPRINVHHKRKVILRAFPISMCVQSLKGRREMNKILSLQKRIIFHSVWTW